MSVSQKLLRWYDRHKHDRAMPWRDVNDAYRTWLSEIMLQQTTVTTVKPYYEKFLQKWPTVQALAKADLEEIRAAWAGLGYYSRASNLHKCAQTISTTYAGEFPSDEIELQKLPGIGPYTAAAIAAIAFNRPANVVDGNVERVMSRLHATNENLRALAATHIPTRRPGDYAQALMDLGALICTPRNPACLTCPLRNDCTAYAAGNPTDYPAKKLKKQEVRFATAYLMRNRKGEVWLRKRPEKGLLAGLWEVPTTPLLATGPSGWDSLHMEAKNPPLTLLNTQVRHIFTHIDARISLALARHTPAGGRWVSLEGEIPDDLPTLTRKILRVFKEGLEKD